MAQVICTTEERNALKIVNAYANRICDTYSCEKCPHNDLHGCRLAVIEELLMELPPDWEE